MPCDRTSAIPYYIEIISVDRQVFLEICSILDLDWREIALAPPAEFPEPGELAKTNIDALV